MNAEPLSDASEKRRKLERELIGSLAGNCADTIESAGWFDADLFLHPGYADLWRWAITAHPDWEAFWRKATDLGIRDEVLNAETETLSWYYGEYIAREIVQLAWLDHANSNVAALTQATARGDTKRAAALLAQLQESQPKQVLPLAVRDMSDAGESFLRILETENRSILTGIPVLDNATGGLERQSQTILAAPPSTGKSALAFQIARNVAASGKKALLPRRRAKVRCHSRSRATSQPLVKRPVCFVGDGGSEPIRPRGLWGGGRDMAGCQARQPVSRAKRQGARGGKRTHVHVWAAPADP